MIWIAMYWVRNQYQNCNMCRYFVGFHKVFIYCIRNQYIIISSF